MSPGPPEAGPGAAGLPADGAPGPAGDASAPHGRERPRVTLIVAATVDGKIATAARGPVTWTSRADRRRLFALRDAVDALLVGAGTLRAEDPPLLPSPARRAARVAAGRPPNPLRVVVSASLDLPAGRALAPADDAPVVLLTGPDAPEGRAAAWAARGVEVVRLPRAPGEAGGPGLDLAAGLERLARARGVREVACEGGGALNAAMLAQDLVDEVRLTVCPWLFGGAGAPTPVDGPGLPAPGRLRLLAVEAEGDEVFLRWAVAPARDGGAAARAPDGAPPAPAAPGG